MTIDAAAILKATRQVTKKWTKHRKSEEKQGKSRATRKYMYSDRVNFSDVVKRILPAAYNHASGNGKFPPSKRQVYYAAREPFSEATGREVDSQYLSNALLVQFMNRNPELTSTWKVTADARGTLEIPNTGHELRIPCGTVQIDEHLTAEAAGHVPLFDIPSLHSEWPSIAAGQRYQAVLYIEKEGFNPQLKKAQIAEKFDLAILSCKGQSVVAARKFVDTVCRADGGIPLFVVHDFDKAGFEIAQRLTTVS